MPPYSIPIDLQIEILLRVKDEVISGRQNSGLCSAITTEYSKNQRYEYSCNRDIARNIICIFNMENAINFANGRDELYWWPIYRKLTLSEKIHNYGFNLKKYLEVSITYNIEPRIKFLDWCIKTLEDIEKENKFAV